MLFDGTCSVPGYCTFCDAEAVKVVPSIVDEDEEPSRFCYSCFQAFLLGQRHPEAQEIAAADEKIRLICPVCGATHNQPITEYELKTKIYCLACSSGDVEMLDWRGIEDLGKVKGDASVE